MTRDDAKRIMENLEVIKHFADGGDLETCLHDYTGKFCRWFDAKNTILLSCLGKYRICKPHVKFKDGEPVILKSNPLPCNRTEH